MAECGTAGTALDRTARSLLLVGGGSTSGDTKQVLSNVLSHVTRTPAATTSLPFHAPDEIVLFAQQQHPSVVSTNTPVPQLLHSIPSPALHHQHPQDMHHTHSHLPAQHYHPMTNYPQFMIQQQMMIQQSIIQQQQMQFIRQQQQQQKAQLVQKQKQTPKITISEPMNIAIDKEPAVVGHEGIVQNTSKEELNNAWYDSLQEDNEQVVNNINYQSHEGNVQGVGIDELATAWAEAAAEYQNVLDENENVDNNLWTELYESETAALAPYDFTNKLSDESGMNDTTLDWMGEGMRQFDLGNLKEAIRAFEIELQQNNPDSATAWRMLGRCHAENDMDRDAILCLEHAVDRDPYCAEALLALGVSYVNELNHTKALNCLKAWITHNPKFAGMEIGEDVYGHAANESGGAGQESSFEEVQRLLLRALELVGNDRTSDSADVLEALGVVYNVSRDYDAAVQSFRNAVAIRPDNYQLWNKLGATLANSNQSSQALPAYHKALQLKPKYARAWLNMAISHSNLQNYDEAARCYLQTLSLNQSAIHCWSYLRIALSCSERWDLIPFAASQNLEAFTEHFDFILY